MDAAIWTAIGLLAAALLGNFYYLGARIDALGTRMDARFDGVDARLDTMNACIDAMSAWLDTHVDAHRRRN